MNNFYQNYTIEEVYGHSQIGKYSSRSNIDDHLELQKVSLKKDDTYMSISIQEIKEKQNDSNIDNLQRYQDYSIEKKIDEDSSDKQRTINSLRRSFYQNSSGEQKRAYGNKAPNSNKIEHLLNQIMSQEREPLALSENSYTKSPQKARQSKCSKKQPQQENNMFKLIFQDVQLISRIRKGLLNFYYNYTYSGKRKYLNQNKNVRKFIHDKSDYFTQDFKDSNNKWQDFFLNIIPNHNRMYQFKVPLINPQSFISLFIQIFFCIYNSMFLFIFSLVIIFQAEIPNEKNLYQLTVIIQLFEMLIKINTTAYQKSQMITLRKQILTIYFKERAFYDIIPAILILYWPDNRIGKLFFQIPVFIKLRNIFLDTKEIEKIILMMLENYYFLILIKLVFKLFCFAHVIACLWYLVAIIEQDSGYYSKSWIDNSTGADGVWWKIYIEAFYWALTLMQTGSNTAITSFEIFFTSFIMLFTTIFFAYILNTIGLILSEIDEKQEQEKMDVNTINKYMRKKNISKNLQRRVNLDIEYYYKMQMKNRQEEEQIVLNKISNELNDLLKTEYNKNIVSKIKCLNNTFSKETIDELCLSLEEVCYFPNQVIFEEGDHKDSSLMFIVSGQGNFFFIRPDQTSLEIKQLSKFLIMKQKNSNFTNYCNSSSFKLISVASLSYIRQTIFSITSSIR